MTPTIYGIPNCDTVKKARAWLDAQGHPHAFHDYRKAGVDRPVLEAAVDRFGWERVLNRAGTTFRKLPDEAKANFDRGRAIELMIAHPSAIKRPLLVRGEAMELGFAPDLYAAFFA